jgi:predicted nucleic acid-binding protein
MLFVVDASVVACWLLPDEDHQIATAARAQLAVDSVIVPTLFWFELRNLLVVNERRGRLDPNKTNRALQLVKSLPITTDMEVDEEALMRIARTRRLTVYDAAYLELAQRTGLTLATLDSALLSAARAEAVSPTGSSGRSAP